jgi:hypothetical protein
MRDSVIFYRSFYEAIKELKPNAQAKIYTAIFEYSLNFNEVVLDGLPKTIFTLIKPQLEANNKKFKNGQKGGKPKAKANQNVTKTEPKPNLDLTEVKANVNVNDNDNDNDNVNDNAIPLEKETKIDFSFKNELIKKGAEENLVAEWIKVRNTKKATNTQTAFNRFINQVESSGKNINFVLTKCVEKSWSGFEANFLTNSNNLNFNGQQATGREITFDTNRG